MCETKNKETKYAKCGLVHRSKSYLNLITNKVLTHNNGVYLFLSVLEYELS